MSDINRRFIVAQTEGGFMNSVGQSKVIVDRLTGVNYLWIKDGYAGGLTPLLDAEGNPIVTPIANL